MWKEHSGVGRTVGTDSLDYLQKGCAASENGAFGASSITAPFQVYFWRKFASVMASLCVLRLAAAFFTEFDKLRHNEN